MRRRMLTRCESWYQASNALLRVWLAWPGRILAAGDGLQRTTTRLQVGFPRDWSARASYDPEVLTMVCYVAGNALVFAMHWMESPILCCLPKIPRGQPTIARGIDWGRKQVPRQEAILESLVALSKEPPGPIHAMESPCTVSRRMEFARQDPAPSTAPITTKCTRFILVVCTF